MLIDRLQLNASGTWIPLPEGIRCEIKHLGHYLSGQLREPVFHRFSLPGIAGRHVEVSSQLL